MPNNASGCSREQPYNLIISLLTCGSFMKNAAYIYTQHFFSNNYFLFGKYRELDITRRLSSDMKDMCTIVVGYTTGSSGHNATDFIFCRNNYTHCLAGVEHHADWAEDDVEFCYLTCRKFVYLTERVVGADIG